MLGGPIRPQESKPHDKPLPQAHQAPLSGEQSPRPGTHWLRRGLPWRGNAAPLRQCSPSGEAGGTNQPPRVVHRVAGV